MRRRDFLAGAATAGALGAVVAPRLARAVPWAAGTIEAQRELLGKGARAERCLEVFAYGGIAQYESFYVVEEHGRPDDPDHPRQGWHLFANQHESVFGNSCGLNRDAWLQDWVTDANGESVKLGPMTAPLRNRPDLLRRMRVFVLRHDLEPHEAAIPYMLSGMRLGNIRMAGMGAHVQRYFQDRATDARTLPYSYVLTPATEVSTDNVRVASTVGLHPGAARPLALRVARNAGLEERLARPHLTAEDRAGVDRLLRHYSEQARARHQTLSGEPLRARALDDHAFALRALATAPDLLSVVGPGLLEPMEGLACGLADGLDHTGVGIKAAVQLLTNSAAPARYVNVIDGGMIEADGGGGYDTHFSQLGTQTVNGTSMLQHVATHINEPGEGDPGKLDLDEDMVLITTEFGRTPYLQEAQGTNHHPYGYVVVMLGGPIGEDQAGLLGTLGRDGQAIDYLTPAEFRAACLAAMGMYPFSHESFAVGDLREGLTELDGLVWLNETVLGRRA